MSHSEEEAVTSPPKSPIMADEDIVPSAHTPSLSQSIPAIPEIPKIDAFNALDIASEIAKEAVKGAADASGLSKENIEEKKVASEEEKDGMNTGPAIETESPLRRSDFEPSSANLKLKGVAEGSSKPKRSLRKISDIEEPATPPSSPRDTTVVDLPSSTEKSRPKDVGSPNAEEEASLEMDEEQGNPFKGTPSGDTFAGIGDIPFPSYFSKEDLHFGDFAQKPVTPKMLTSSHTSDSGLNFPDQRPEDTIDVPDVEAEDYPQHCQYFMLRDKEMKGRHWRVRTPCKRILNSLEEQYPNLLINFKASRLLGGSALDLLCEVVVCLQQLRVKDFSLGRYNDVISSVVEMEHFGLELGWLRVYLKKVVNATMLFTKLYQIQRCEEQIVEAEEKVAKLKVRRELLLEDKANLEVAEKIELSDDDLIFPEIDLIASRLNQ
jgi:hypothetical protein